MSKNKTDTSQLSVKQMVVLEKLADNTDVEEVARITGTAKGTVYRWLQNNDFKTKLTSMRSDILDASLNLVKAQCRRAVDKIATLMNSDNEMVALKAATYLLDKALDVKTVQELEQRLIQIEVKIQNNHITTNTTTGATYEVHNTTKQTDQN
ncbi:MAG TPA: hypothetical protein DD381_07020 [Lentisphaeria bacterium]|nr:MAG: hypothetical protein A2X47_10885 [Lentisphaerae bacterium GWF2_38_69]HBM16075.1 hypothetical protein [Lentisphaeria bacterium]